MTLDPCASNEEIIEFAKKAKMNPTDVKHAQVAYLTQVLKYPRLLVSSITGYAESTISTWKKKCLEWLGRAVDIFEKGIEIIDQFITKVCGDGNAVVWEAEKTDKPCAYIVEYFDKTGNFMNLKIGMSTRVEQRMKEHLYNKKTNNGLAKIVVKYIFKCEDEDDAGAMECVLRKHYRHKNNNADYVPNDRFSTQRFNLEDILSDENIKHESARLCY